MTISTGWRRLASIMMLLALGLALLALSACGGDSDEADEEPSGTATPDEQFGIEDLPPEGRIFAYAAGAQPFDGDAAQFLVILPFDPVLPTAIPGDRKLTSATIVPSRFGGGKRDEGATLILEYRGEGEDDWIQLTEQKQPMPDLSALELETVEVGDVEALVMPFPDSDAIQISWNVCDITFAISSHVIDAEAAGEMGSSMDQECASEAPKPTGDSTEKSRLGD